MQSAPSEFDVVSALEVLSMPDIINSLPHGTFKYAVRRSRPLLHQAAVALSPDQHQLIVKAALSKSKKRKSVDVSEHDIASFRDVLVDTGNPSNSKRPKTLIEPERHCDEDADSFLESVPKECRRERLVKFIEATGHDAMKTLICAVCAGRFFNNEIRPIKVLDLKNGGKLIPHSVHTAHELTDGMLLHRCAESMFHDDLGTYFA